MKKLILLIILFTANCFAQITYTPTGGKTIYDLQSIGTPVHIIQDKNNPDNIHALYISSPFNDTTFSQRQVQYFFSSDKGQTWSFLTDFSFALSAANFPSISLLSTGSAIISMHGAVLPVRTYTFVDAFPGLGSFTSLGTSPCAGAWPMITAANNVNQTNKFHIINSGGFTSGLSLTNSSYTPCSSFQDGGSPNYSIAESNSGKVGIAYVSSVNLGDVYFLESSDNGQTFGTPIKIYDAVVNPDNTFMGGFRGISLVYNVNTPNITFDVAKQNTAGNFYPAEPAGIMHWSSTLPGSDPSRSKLIARNDSSNVYPAYIPFYKAYGNDVLTSICRPSIGLYGNELALAVVFMASTPNVKIKGSDTICYNALYITYAGSNGLSWKKPKKITPDELKDWTYPSLSPYNPAAPNNYFANIVATRDSIPGSFVNNRQFGQSLAEQYFIKSSEIIFIEPPTLTSTSGNVKYNDNNQLVTGGTVKALKFNTSTGQADVITSAPIDANGNYGLGFDIPYGTYYIVAYPNSEPTSDFIPTYYPQTINWQNALTINSAQNNSGINIGVFRKNDLNGSDSFMGVVNKLNNFNQQSLLPQTSLFIKSGNNFVGYAESNGSGRYSFSNLPNGNYEVIASKLGFTTSTKNVSLNSPSMDSVNFALNQILIGIHSVSDIIPENFSLYQNYPNPFNPVTNIKFDIPKSSFVTMKIYNVIGKEVAVLLNENKSAGSYVVDFDASALSSGVYFYRIETEGFSETKRMVILK